MTNLINKLLAVFHLKLVSTKPVNLVDETVKFLNTVPKGALCDGDMTGYIGDINYVTDKNGKTYVRQDSTANQYICDYDGDPNVPLKQMFDETSFTEREMREKLK